MRAAGAGCRRLTRRGLAQVTERLHREAAPTRRQRFYEAAAAVDDAHPILSRRPAAARALRLPARPSAAPRAGPRAAALVPRLARQAAHAGRRGTRADQRGRAVPHGAAAGGRARHGRRAHAGAADGGRRDRRRARGRVHRLAAARRHRQRQDRSVSARHRRHAARMPARWCWCRRSRSPIRSSSGCARASATRWPSCTASSRVGERWDEWRRIARGAARIVVGARSAVFAPLRRLGLIVVDEEHDAAYKQADGVHYHGRDVAVMRAKLAGCPIVLGSATPSMESLVERPRRPLPIARAAGARRRPAAAAGAARRPARACGRAAAGADARAERGAGSEPRRRRPEPPVPQPARLRQLPPVPRLRRAADVPELQRRAHRSSPLARRCAATTATTPFRRRRPAPSAARRR